MCAGLWSDSELVRCIKVKLRHKLFSKLFFVLVVCQPTANKTRDTLTHSYE